jgi:hypothetical protein
MDEMRMTEDEEMRMVVNKVEAYIGAHDKHER